MYKIFHIMNKIIYYGIFIEYSLNFTAVQPPYYRIFKNIIIGIMINRIF